MFPPRNILHPTDFSERSAVAFELASALARDYGAQLTVLHVLQEPIILFTEAIVPPRDDNHREELRRKLLAIGDPASLNITHELVEGHPATEILRVAGATQADLIVMGTHGRLGLRRLLMGSVAERVVEKASCPVLTVKTPFAESVPADELMEEPALA